MMPESNHDEVAEHLAIVDIKVFLGSKIEPGQRILLAKNSGFKDVEVGYQDATVQAEHGNTGIGVPSKDMHRSWLMITGVKKGA